MKPRHGMAGLLLCLLPMLAIGKSGDRAAQIKTESTSTNAAAGPNEKSVLTGSVRITQGTMVATGDQADIYTGSDSQVTRVVLTGARAHLEQMDDQDHLMQADARQIDYDLATGQAVLTGEASARKASMGVSTAPKILYNTDNGTFSAEGTESEPVHMTLYPSARKTQP
jgi:lipopolysaccharide export system protein LptA